MSESEPTRQTTTRLETEERDRTSSGNGANGECLPSSINQKSSTATTEQRQEVMEEGGAGDEERLEELRLLLLGHYQGQMIELQQTIDELSTRTSDKDGLIRT